MKVAAIVTNSAITLHILVEKCYTAIGTGKTKKQRHKWYSIGDAAKPYADGGKHFGSAPTIARALEEARFIAHETKKDQEREHTALLTSILAGDNGEIKDAKGHVLQEREPRHRSRRDLVPV